MISGENFYDVLIFCSVGSEVSGLPSLLHAASLAVQLMQHGRSLQSGLTEACMDVFVRNQLSQVNRQVIRYEVSVL